MQTEIKAKVEENKKDKKSFKNVPKIDLNREKIRVEIKAEVEKASPKIPSRPLNVTNLKKNSSLSNGSGTTSKVEAKKEVQSLPAVYQEMQELLKDAVDKSMESANVTKFSSEVKGETPQFQYNVVVAIDFGTTFSGYAYSFTHDPENIHIMRKWEGKFTFNTQPRLAMPVRMLAVDSNHTIRKVKFLSKI